MRCVRGVFKHDKFRVEVCRESLARCNRKHAIVHTPDHDGGRVARQHRRVVTLMLTLEFMQECRPLLSVRAEDMRIQIMEQRLWEWRRGVEGQGDERADVIGLFRDKDVLQGVDAEASEELGLVIPAEERAGGAQDGELSLPRRNKTAVAKSDKTAVGAADDVYTLVGAHEVLDQ